MKLQTGTIILKAHHIRVLWRNVLFLLGIEKMWVGMAFLEGFVVSGLVCLGFRAVQGLGLRGLVCWGYAQFRFSF